MRRCGAVVAGTGLPNADGSLRSQLIRRHCKNGVSVYLRREPTSHDSANAVAVYLEAPRVLGLFGKVLRQIGYIKTSRVKDIARRGGWMPGKKSGRTFHAFMFLKVRAARR